MSVEAAELQKMIDMGLLLALDQLKRFGKVTPVILAHEPGCDTIHNVMFPDRFAHLMNDGDAKDLIFAKLREIVKKDNLDAMVFATEAWFGRMTEKAKQLSAEKMRKLQCERGFATGLRQGYIERREAVVINLQTPDSFRMVTQFFKRHEVLTREITLEDVSDTGFQPIDTFRGRQKMFGDLKPENLR